MEFKIEKNKFRSAEDTCDISYVVYSPKDLAKGIIQIFHDANDGIERYIDFAEYLCNEGFIVCGCDLTGFGESCTEIRQGGYLGKAVEDHFELYQIMRKKYRYLPYMVFSMGVGAVIAKKFVYDYPDAVDGIIFGGIICEFDGMSRLLSSIISIFKGKFGKSALLDKRCFSKYASEYQANGKAFAYLSSREDEQSAIAENKTYNCMLTASSIRYLGKLFGEFSANNWYEAYPSNVFTLLMYGEEDSLCLKGKSSRDMMEGFSEFSSLSDIDCIGLEYSRHDFLHDVAKDKAYEVSCMFFNKVVDGVNEARSTDRDILKGF